MTLTEHAFLFRTAPHARASGHVIAGRYQLGKCIGRGGMGTVYRATDLVHDEPVAVKIISLGTHAYDIRSRVYREALILRTIQDRHAVRLHDVGSLPDGSLYLVMELLDGRDLAAVLKDGGPLDVDVAVDFVLQACEAISEAHARGVVHRDLKPHNMFLTTTAAGEAVVKVIDFGIAKCGRGFTPDARALTQPNTSIGSPRYMAPEQMESADAVDCRADIWSLGVILFELVTGRAPYNGDSLMSIFNAVLHGVAPKPSEVRPGVPVELDAVVARCMSLAPKNRYANVLELADALAPFASAAGRVSAGRIATAPPPASASRKPASASDVTTSEVRTAATPGLRRSRRSRHIAVAQRALPKITAAMLLAASVLFAIACSMR